MPRKKTYTGKDKNTAPSKRIQAEEIIKCGTDPKYFINRYVKISHPMHGLVPFKTFPYQNECLEAFQQNKYTIVNKSRQLGLSTISAAYSLWMCIFQKEKNILVIATKLAVAKEFIKKVETMHHNLPEWLVMPKIKAQSVQYIRFTNGSQVHAIPTSADAGRSAAISLLVIDECVHSYTSINIRNKTTGEMKNVTMDELFLSV